MTKVSSWTTTYDTLERYTYTLTNKSLWKRLRAIWGLLVKGKIKVEWFVPSAVKDKRLRLTGKREV